MPYIKFIFENETYGPLNAPSSLRSICKAMKFEITLMNLCLIRIDDNHGNFIVQNDKSITCMDEPITEGLYQLLSTNVKNNELNLEVLNPQIELRSKIINLEYTNELEKDRLDGNTPVSYKKLELLVDDMICLIAAIPTRYVHYNVILSHKVNLALIEVTKFHTKCKNEWKAENKKVITVLEGTRTYAYQRIITILWNVWEAVWIKFGPALRMYHPSDPATGEILNRVQHFLNRFHCWRRIMESGKKNILESSYTVKQITSPGLLYRFAEYIPPILYMKHPWNDPLREFVLINGVEIDFKANNRVSNESPKSILNKLRKKFIAEMIMTKAFKNEDLSNILNEIMFAIKLENSSISDNYLKAQIEKEFNFSSNNVQVYKESKRVQTEPVNLNHNYKTKNNIDKYEFPKELKSSSSLSKSDDSIGIFLKKIR